jgi:hypothetical protein
MSQDSQLSRYGKIQDHDYSIHEKWTPRASYGSAMLKGIQQESLLSFYFFSIENIEHLQWLIRRKIYEMSDGKYKIDKQNQDELLVIMRSVYLEYSINNREKINRQIVCLNNKVLEYVCPQVLSSVRMYEQYLRDSTQPYNTMERPQFESMRGTKSYDLSKFL